LASIFALVGILPGLLIYAVSYQFVTRSIEVWFDTKVEVALDAGLNLSRSTLESLSNELAARATTEKLFAVFDQTIWDGPGKSARIPANPLLERAGGTILRAESAVDLARQMGVPSEAFVETLTQYNQALADGSLHTLPTPRSEKVTPMPIVRAPLMAIPICPGITYTMVGIDIDAQGQVLDVNATPIPGLFAAGATTGGLEGGQDSAYIGGLIKSGSFGLLAAERIASLEGKQVLLEQPQRYEPKAAAQVEAESDAGAAGRQSLGKNTSAGVQQSQGSGLDHGAAITSSGKSYPSTAYGLARFPVLRTTIRFGKAIAIGLSLVVTLTLYALLSGSLGWVSAPVAIGLGVLVLVVVLGVVELIKLVTEFLIPE
jgi:fumarate reductase flavoprotein subunit